MGENGSTRRFLDKFTFMVLKGSYYLLSNQLQL